MLISPEYKKLNAQLHDDRDDYGSNGQRHADAVAHYAENYLCSSILDYGCGKGTLAKAMRERFNRDVAEYDPCIEGKDALPEPADLVVCTDVLEHIEPEMLDNVLNHLRDLTKNIGLFLVHTGPAKKILQDGRNAHLIQQHPHWWLQKIIYRWDLVSFTRLKDGFCVTVQAKKWQASSMQ